MKTGMILLTIVSVFGFNRLVVAATSAPQSELAAVTACHNAEATVVGGVKVQINIYAATAMAQAGSANLKYPKKLDTAADGPASSQNKFFVTVLDEGVTDPTWSKKGATYSHTCPDGTKAFSYNAKTGIFE